MKILIAHISFWGAVLGALIIALHSPYSGYGFIPYLISNFASLYLLKQPIVSKALSYQLIFFIVINIIGVICWLL